jgi:MFS family permease
MLVGAIVAASLVGRRRLSRPFAAGLALWGLPLAAVAAWPQTGVALTAFAVAGLGNAVLDVSGFTLIQRVAPDRALGRVFGVMFVGVVASVGLGSIAAPVAIDLLGLRWALASTGAILPLLAVVLLPRLTKVDSRAVVADSTLDAIAAVPLFAPLPPVSQEKLARAATPLPLAAGETLMRAGERGDAFYVLLDGALRVTDEGLALRDLGPGDCCGEIALMRDVPRTATVEAVTDARLLVVHRPDFLSAVLGTPEAGAAAERIITQRLAATAAPGRVER